MLEIRYDKNTKELTGWWGSRFGNHEVKLKNRPNEAIITLDISLPAKPMEAYLMKADLTGLEDNPDYLPTPPLSTHLGRVVDINPGAERPATIVRTWNGNEYTYDCFVSESVKDQWQAGDIVVGDFVVIHFLENDIDRAIVIAKVFKTW